MNPKKVLLVCMGNTCRSPVLEAMLRQTAKHHGLGDRFVFESAGTNEQCTGKPANEHSIECTFETGNDITSHRARFVGSLNLRDYALIVAVDPETLIKLQALDPGANYMVANAETGGIPNPFGKGRPAYDEMMDSTEKALPGILARLQLELAA